MKKIGIVPAVHGVGGMVSFRDRFVTGLQWHSGEITVSFDLQAELDAVLVIGGTRALFSLWQARRQGVRIVQRLNGMNWLHKKLPTGLKHFLRAEYGNLILRIIRRHLADQIIYQSRFSRDWWQREFGETAAPHTVIYNGVDLAEFSPEDAGSIPQWPRPQAFYRILMVEGSLAGGYELGLESAIGMVEKLNNAHSHEIYRPVHLTIAGRVSENIRAKWAAQTATPIEWAGLVPKDQIPGLDRAAHLLYAADINAACPNAVIEALACGTPVLAFDTGALAEMVPPEAGRVIPYGADPWQLQPPDIAGLAVGAAQILQQPALRAGARRRAEAFFGLDQMVNYYLDVLC